MSALTIITTRAQLLPDKSNENALFSRKNCEVHETVLLNSNDGFKRGALYQVKDALIFGVKCLDENDHGGRHVFIQNLFSDIFTILKEKSKEITEIFLFAHGHDLGQSTLKISNCNDHSLLKELDWLNTILGGDKKAVKGDGGNPDPSSLLVPVYFTAFSHTNDVPIYEVLNNPAWFIKNKFEKLTNQETRSLESVFSLLSKSLVLGWSNEKKQDALSLGSSKLLDNFSFEGYFWDFVDGKNGVFDANDQPFLWETGVWEKISGSEGDWKINVVFFPTVAISEQNALSFYEKIKEKFGDSNDPSPIIFISSEDIMQISEDAIRNERSFFPLDRRHRFLDSSIWYRYVALEGDFWENLDRALETIAWAYSNRLYRKNVCKEFREFQTRMIVESYIKSTYGSGHAQKVFPFTFHSETKMEQEGRNTHQILESATLQWNLLMVDDFAQTTLREDANSGTGNTKGDIVRQILGNNFPSNFDDAQNNSLLPFFDFSQTIEEAKKKLGIQENSIPPEKSNIIYDIILLDYLFSNPIDDKDQVDPYGTALLDYIQTAARVDGVGVMQNYWIYPISVFNEAIQSHLQEKGYQYMENRWQLSRGADPLNTPHLFRRSLFKFMEAQAEKVQFTEEGIWRFVAYDMPSLLKTSDDTQQKGNHAKDSESLDRSKAASAFRKFIEKFSIDEGMPSNSALASSIRKKLVENKINDLRDHLSQLLYLLGFSVGFDFPIIQQEFLAVEEAFRNFDYVKNGPNEELISRIKSALKNLSTAVYSIHGKYY